MLTLEKKALRENGSNRIQHHRKIKIPALAATDAAKMRHPLRFH